MPAEPGEGLAPALTRILGAAIERVPLADPVAIATAVQESLSSGSLDQARSHIQTARRVLAGTLPTRRLELLVRM